MPVEATKAYELVDRRIIGGQGDGRQLHHAVGRDEAEIASSKGSVEPAAAAPAEADRNVQGKLPMHGWCGGMGSID